MKIQILSFVIVLYKKHFVSFFVILLNPFALANTTIVHCQLSIVHFAYSSINQNLKNGGGMEKSLKKVFFF